MIIWSLWLVWTRKILRGYLIHWNFFEIFNLLLQTCIDIENWLWLSILIFLKLLYWRYIPAQLLYHDFVSNLIIILITLRSLQEEKWQVGLLLWKKSPSSKLFTLEADLPKFNPIFLYIYNIKPNKCFYYLRFVGRGEVASGSAVVSV